MTAEIPPPNSPPGDLTILVLPPTRRDGEAISKLLTEAGVQSEICSSVSAVCRSIADQVGALIISEEAINEDAAQLRACLATQPIWSDLPIIILSRAGRESTSLHQIIAGFSNVSIVERPVRVSTFLSMARTALRARLHQYRVRDAFAQQQIAEQELRRSREQLKIIVRGADVGIWHCDLPFDKLHWDDTVKAHFHLPTDAEVDIDLFFERLHPDDRERVQAVLTERLADGRLFDVEYRTMSEDHSEIRWIRAMGRCYYSAERVPIRFDGITLDVTSRTLAEQRLREESHIVEVINQVGRLIAAELDLDKLVQYVVDVSTELTNAEFGAFFYNVSNEQGESYSLYRLSGVDAEHFAQFPMPRATNLFGPTFRGEASILIDDVTEDPRYGKNAPYFGMPPGHLPVRSYLAVPVISRNGQVLGGLFFGHSEPNIFQNRAERLVAGIAAQAAVAIDNAQLYQSVREADRRKDEFLAMLAHELRNPLAPVRTGLELLSLSGVRHESIPLMRQQVDHLVRLVDDLLDVSRIMRQKIQLRLETIDLVTLINQAIASARATIAAHRHTLIVSTPPGSIWVRGDSVRLMQIVNNLLGNATKYTPDGGHLWVTIASEGASATISVRDDGIGLDAALLPHVFELFTQADRSLERSEGGLGIGLTLVRSLVHLHGGQVQAESAGPGAGSEFTVTLPLTKAPAQVEQPPPPMEAFAPCRILIVDDNVGNATIHSLLMAKLGDHEIQTAHDGPTAIEAAEAFLPDIILLDIGLPRMSGYDVAQHLRQNPALQSTMLVALTGYGAEEDRRRSQAAGFDLHLVKPPSLDALKHVLMLRSTGGWRSSDHQAS